MRISNTGLNTGAPRRLGVCSLVTLALSASTALAQTTDFIGKFSSPTTLDDSVLYQNGQQIGLGTSSPLDFMSIRFDNTGGGRTGLALQNTNGSATSYSGALMYDHLGATAVFQGFNNSTKEYRINNVASGRHHPLPAGRPISRFFVSSAGNVGIGTMTCTIAIPEAPFLAKFQTSGFHREPRPRLFDSSTTGVSLQSNWPGIGFNSYYSGSSRTINTGYGGIIQVAQDDGSMRFATAPLMTGQGIVQPTPERMRITNDGVIGIGTTTPTQAKVVISGAAGGFPINIYREYNASVGVTAQQNGNGVTSSPVSLYATSFIVSPSFIAFSDERIKRIDGRSDSMRDLETLAGIVRHGLHVSRHHRQGFGEAKEGHRAAGRDRAPPGGEPQHRRAAGYLQAGRSHGRLGLILRPT